MLAVRILLAGCALSMTVSGCEGAGRLDTACRSNADCETTQYCASGVCGDEGFGECVDRPTSCDDEPDSPACGCDGVTYPNTCTANLNGQRIAQQGACFCNDGSECVDTQYCSLQESCFNLGTCIDRPTMCLPEPETVCGCDGTDYESACVAAQAGARTSALGACTCSVNADCAGGEFCNAVTCDGPGDCTSLPTNCPDQGAEATGCDGVIYPNACEANAAGVRAPCSGNSDCVVGDYCNGATCDGPGSCTVQPTDCPTEGPPVCGCDGATYENACFAALAGVRIDFLGACPCEANTDCVGSQYCSGDTCEGSGECAVRPSDCPTGGPAVCGCDGVDYENACFAAQAGARVDFIGMCQ